MRADERRTRNDLRSVDGPTLFAQIRQRIQTSFVPRAIEARNIHVAHVQADVGCTGRFNTRISCASVSRKPSSRERAWYPSSRVALAWLAR